MVFTELDLCSVLVNCFVVQKQQQQNLSLYTKFRFLSMAKKKQPATGKQCIVFFSGFMKSLLYVLHYEFGY